MPYVNVHVDADEVLEDISESDLRAELARRALRKGGSVNHADYQIPVPVARQALDDASQLLRKLGRVDLAFKLDEIREDYLP
jgi:hypothetical protein